MDFVADVLTTHKRVKMLTRGDDFTRECPRIEVDFSIGGTGSPAFSMKSPTPDLYPVSSFPTTVRSSSARRWTNGLTEPDQTKGEGQLNLFQDLGMVGEFIRILS